MAIRFEIVLNEQEPIVSGFSEEFYVMTATLSAAMLPDRGQDLALYIGGLIRDKKTSTLWLNQTLKVGDEIRMRIVEDSPITEPIEKPTT